MPDRLPAGHRNALVRYGIRLLACQLGQALPADGPLAPLLAPPDVAGTVALEASRQHLGDTANLDAPADAGRLRSIFSLLALDDQRQRKPLTATIPRRPLDLNLLHRDDLPANEIWHLFAADAARLRPGPGQIASFTALLARYGWSVPCSLLVPGISVYEQFRAIAALMATVTPDGEELLLVEADLCGIQDMLFTISAKGAAKHVRGRSLYLQLLIDALLRVVLATLELPEACLISSAGGNARLLARVSDAPALAAIRRALNQRLLLLHGGDLAFALAWTPVVATALADDSFAAAAAEVALRLDEQKARAFAELAADAPSTAVGVSGAGRRDFCRVCHVELPDRRYLPADDGSGDGLRCDQCDSFGERRANRPPGDARGMLGLARLAADAARDLDEGRRAYLEVTVGSLPPPPDPSAWYGRPAWDAALAALGVIYRFTVSPRPAPGSTVICLNDTNMLPDVVDPACAYVFRFLALATPRIIERGPEQEALSTFGARLAAEHAASPTCPDELADPVEPDTIRSLSLMARWDSTGVECYGVLRMDVDDLGRLFHHRLESRSLLHSAALSAALTRFFEGWLNEACHHVDAAWRELMPRLTDDAAWRKRMHARPGIGEYDLIPARRKAPYVLYAGGDDMLVVGPWDVLPPLAARIRRDFCSYVLRGYVDRDAPLDEAPVTISAGIVIEPDLYPLSQAAEQAGAALRTAKSHRRRSPTHGTDLWVTAKDAITFLDMTVSWEELAQAEALAHTLARLIDLGVLAEGHDRADRAPHALIQLLASVAQSYAEAGGDLAERRLAYGRWMPLLAHGLRRIADRVPAGNPELRRQILGLAGETLDLTRVAGATEWHTLRFLALPVRWAQLLIRTGG